MVQAHTILAYLLRCNLISSERIVDSDLLMEDVSARNSNCKVVSEHGPSYLLKQGVGADRIATLEREAAVYKMFWSGGAGNRFCCYLPHLIDYDKDQHLLILEFLLDAETLWERHLRIGRFPGLYGAELGIALSQLHTDYTVDKLSEEQYSRLQKQPAFILSLHRPHLRYIDEASSANLRLIEIVQRFSQYGEALDELRAGWRPSCLVHGDIKWNNVLVVPASNRARRSPSLRIVDWELSMVGDPCWDVGSVFSDYLSFWLASIPITGEESPDRFLRLARYPIRKMQPAMHDFWNAYARGMGLSQVEREHWLIQSVRYAAARLLQTAYEEGQLALRPTGNVICLLQLSLNMLLKPVDAAIALLGIDEVESRNRSGT